MKSKSEYSKSSIVDFIEALAVALVLALAIRAFLFQAFTIPSGSMLNTIQIGDYLLVNKFLYGVKIPFTDKYLFRGEDPQRGDIIVFKFPGDESVDYIKRIVGVPGDVIEVRNKQLYRNGNPVRESYIQHTHPNLIGRLDNIGPLTVPEDEYFVMGDNRDNSEDSRAWGTGKRFTARPGASTGRGRRAAARAGAGLGIWWSRFDLRGAERQPPLPPLPCSGARSIVYRSVEHNVTAQSVALQQPRFLRQTAAFQVRVKNDPVPRL